VKYKIISFLKNKLEKKNFTGIS